MLLKIILIITGFILLINGANFLVNGASNIAKKFHISEIVIGLTIVSIGTSAIIKPIQYDFNYNMDMYFLIAGMLLLGLFSIIPPKNKINRSKGLILFGLYVMYMLLLFI